MNTLLFGIIFISPPIIKKWILRLFCRGRFGCHSSIGWFSAIIGSRIQIGNYSHIKPFTLIRCSGEIKIGAYTEISSFAVVYGCGNFTAGDKCYIGPQTWINVSEDVVIGHGAGIGPRSMIFTHGSFLPYTEGYPIRFGKVIIGNSVWIAAGVFIHPGVRIGDNVLVNSRSVIKKDIPSGWYVEGFPGKEIRPMDEICHPINLAERDKLITNILRHFRSFLQNTKKQIRHVEGEDEFLSFRFRGKDYLVVLVDHQRTASLDLQPSVKKRMIILLNRINWIPPLQGNQFFIFDFSTMKTKYSKDKIHQELYKFMRMYYGIVFEYD
jgi:acetyltransferase-like isoleucine patch superfamily enzyme